MDVTLDAELDFVVVAVIVGIVARSEGGAIPFRAAIGVVQPMGGIEMDPANDDGGRHA
jgi:hypothetical protein